MNLITFYFEIAEEDQLDFIRAVGELTEFWKDQGFTVSLFRDKSRKSHFLQTFLTDKSVDELTGLIQNQLRAKAAFERIRNSKSRVVVSFMDQIL